MLSSQANLASSKQHNQALQPACVYIVLQAASSAPAAKMAQHSAPSSNALGTCVALDLGLGVDVADIRCNAGGARDIVQGQLANIRGELQALARWSWEAQRS